jgi:ABC-2 type transport system ATP-binding protein
MISVESLTKTFADSKAVNDVSFRVERGEVLGFLGPNGAGKTTTMRMLTCYVPPTSGTAKVGGYDIYEQPVEVRRQIGYLPENVPLYGEMRVDEFLRFRARLKGVPRSRIGARLDAVTERCGIGDVRRRIIERLSKGYRQRVGLAETLLHEPPVLILDEPTVGLDPKQIRQVPS